MDYSRKQSIIPPELKQNVDEILKTQLFGVNQYYAESNPRISTLMKDEINKTSVEFLSELKKRWNWHNHFYEDLLEPAINELLLSNIEEMSPSQLKILCDVYKTCCLVDEATLVMSGAIKKHLEKRLLKISTNSEDVNAEYGRNMLLTPPTASFFLQYQEDHLRYIVLLKTNIEEAKEYRRGLLKKYHINDEQIFEKRFKRDFQAKMNDSVEDLLSEISKYKISEVYKTEHLYFTLEHPERKAFCDIITYDNVDEKFISSQLIGISGFIVRKKILEYLNSSQKLINTGMIYEFPNETIFHALDKLLEEKNLYLEKKIIPYKQHGMTCAISCMLMILKKYDIIPQATKRYEDKYFLCYHSYYLDGVPFAALAWHFAKNGLQTEIIHSEKEIFKNSRETISPKIFNLAMKEYYEFLRNAECKGAKINNGNDITIDLLKKKLKEDSLIILAGQMGNIFHALLLAGYTQKGFVIYDPLYGNRQIKSFSETFKFMNTDIGKWCVVVSQKKVNLEKLLYSLQFYDDEAKKMLKIR